MDRPQLRLLCVRRGPSSLPQKGGGALLPNFRPISIVAKWLDASKYHLVWMLASAQGTLCYMETQSFLPNKGGRAPSQFSAHFYCAQTAACIKMPLSMEVGLSPGEFVLDGDPASLPKRGRGTGLRLRISKLDRKCGALPVVANFVDLEQHLVKTTGESV